MKNLLAIMSLFVFLQTMSGQKVTTEVYSDTANAFTKYPQLAIKDSKILEQVKMAPIDLRDVLEEDQKNANRKDIPFRFGKGTDVEISIDNGKWIFMEDSAIWTLKIISEGAFSINLVLSELYLPKGTLLYIYNESGSMLSGPLTSDHNFSEGSFFTELIQGESRVIRIIIFK